MLTSVKSFKIGFEKLNKGKGWSRHPICEVSLQLTQTLELQYSHIAELLTEWVLHRSGFPHSEQLIDGCMFFIKPKCEMSINNKRLNMQHFSPLDHFNVSHDAHPQTLHQDSEQIEALYCLNHGHAHQIGNLQDQLHYLWCNCCRFKLRQKPRFFFSSMGCYGIPMLLQNEQKINQVPAATGSSVANLSTQYRGKAHKDTSRNNIYIYIYICSNK